MHPFLIDWQLGAYHLKIPTYGFLLATAFMVGYFVSLRRAIQLKISSQQMESFFLLAIVGSLIGGRFFHVFFEEWSYYRAHPSKILAIWEGGYTFYGGLLTSFLFLFSFARLKKISFLNLMDASTLGGTLGLSIGRMGCFFAGCCWGRPTSMPWGVAFDASESLSQTGKKLLHPTQIYESLLGLLLFFFAHYRIKKQSYPGQIFIECTLLYSLGRIIIENYRGDDYRGSVFNGTMSYSQLISLCLIVALLVARRRLSRAAIK